MNQKEFDQFTANMNPEKVVLVFTDRVMAKMAEDEDFDIKGFTIWSTEGA